jgi:hypothetical protein
LPRTAQGDGFDLDELVRIAEDGDAQQSARRVMRPEGRAHDIPDDDQVGPLAGTTAA